MGVFADFLNVLVLLSSGRTERTPL